MTGSRLLTVLLLLGCTDRRTTAGWAAEVPADATRFVEQLLPAATPPATATAAPAIAAQVQDEPDAPPAPEKRWGATVGAPAELTVWHAYRAAEKEALEGVIASWNGLGTPITVKLRVVPFDAFNDKITVVVPEGRGPDLFIFAHDLVGAWAEMGILEPLSSWTTEEDTAGFFPNTVSALVYRDALYGLPLAFKCVALYYDKARIPTPPATLEALIETAKAHTDGQERFGLVYEAANLYFHAPWVHGFGGEVLDSSEKARIHTPAAEQALSLARRFVVSEKVTPPSITTAMVSGYFNDKKAAMVINGPWMRGEISGVDYGVAPLPEVAPGQPARPFLGVEAVFMNKRSEKKAAAMELMRFLVSNDSARLRFDTGKQPVANLTVWDKAPVDPTMEAFRTQARTAVVMSSSPRMQQVWTPYNGALLKSLTGDTDPAAALGEAQTEVDANMARAAGGP